MSDGDSELHEVVEMLKVRLNLLKEAGFTYIVKDKKEEVIMDTVTSSLKKSLSVIKEELGDCTRCKLCQGRNNIVFGAGSEEAQLVFVGEGPGAEEDKQGMPFVGRAGQLLTKMIEAMGYTREQVYICNVVKCRPPQNRDPEADEVLACEPFLKAQLAAIKPKVIVGLGRVACQTLLKTTTPMAKMRGQWQTYDGIRFMPTFHPAYLLRNPPAKKEAWEDLQMVMTELAGVPKKGN